MSTLTEIRTAIVATLEAISDIGVIHNHEPYLKTEAKLRDFYLSGGTIKGWHVRRIATRETAPFIGQKEEAVTWRIWGVQAFSDDGSSEIAFDGSIEAIRDAFRADETLGGRIARTGNEDVTGIQVEQSGPVMFCGVLCHSASLLLVTEQYL